MRFYILIIMFSHNKKTTLNNVFLYKGSKRNLEKNNFNILFEIIPELFITEKNISEKELKKSNLNSLYELKKIEGELVYNSNVKTKNPLDYQNLGNISLINPFINSISLQTPKLRKKYNSMDKIYKNADKLFPFLTVLNIFKEYPCFLEKNFNEPEKVKEIIKQNEKNKYEELIGQMKKISFPKNIPSGITGFSEIIQSCKDGSTSIELIIMAQYENGIIQQFRKSFLEDEGTNLGIVIQGKQQEKEYSIKVLTTIPKNEIINP